MDFRRSVEAMIPGVQGRVLGALAMTGAELSMRQVATLAGVSQTQANQILGALVRLGVVERRDVGRSALVQLNRASAAGQLVQQLADIRLVVLDGMQHSSKSIQPAPASLVVFGSFARGGAEPESDIDVLAVRAAGVEADDQSWVQTLGTWADDMTALAGNRVNLLDLDLADLGPDLRINRTLWRAIVGEGVVLAGAPPAELTSDG